MPLVSPQSATPWETYPFRSSSAGPQQPSAIGSIGSMGPIGLPSSPLSAGSIGSIGSLGSTSAAPGSHVPSASPASASGTPTETSASSAAPGSAAPGTTLSGSGTLHGSVPGSARGSISGPSMTGPSSGAAMACPKLSQPSLRDLTLSPSSRRSVSGNSVSTVVGSRSSLSSLGSIGSISSRASLASIGSFSTADSVCGFSDWPHEDGSGLSSGSSGSATTGSLGLGLGNGKNKLSIAASAPTLSVSGLPRDCTLRECHLIFALALDLLSIEVSRKPATGELTVFAKFSTIHAAQAAAQVLERRVDLFGTGLKTSVQALGPQVMGQNPPRSLYSSRPLFAESYWSQQPMSPLSPGSGNSSGADLFSSSRRQSLSSDPPYSAGSTTQVNLSPLSPSHSYDSAAAMAAAVAATSGTNHGSSAPQSSPQSTTGTDTHKMPPPNPADQNPPCNTLYVGNLPPDTSEAELKDLFGRQPGYRRLCFRTKQNGPMCFVEFEDEALAGKALSDLYGVTLSNSVKGGIRLSYSKNPLGVRSRPPRGK